MISHTYDYWTSPDNFITFLIQLLGHWRRDLSWNASHTLFFFFFIPVFISLLLYVFTLATRISSKKHESLSQLSQSHLCFSFICIVSHQKDQTGSGALKEALV